ncbi:MAG: hypothetical protein AAFN77_16795 [Planctomycetota bacterium]
MVTAIIWAIQQVAHFFDISMTFASTAYTAVALWMKYLIRVAIGSAIIAVVWFFESTVDFVVLLLCGVIDAGVYFVAQLDIDLSHYEQHLLVTGQSLYVMEYWIPIAEVLFLVGVYYSLASVVWIARHAIKFVPFIG